MSAILDGTATCKRPECRATFPAGSGRLYCSDACRWVMHRTGRSKGHRRDRALGHFVVMDDALYGDVALAAELEGVNLSRWMREAARQRLEREGHR